MGMVDPEGEAEDFPEVFTLAQLKATPPVPPGSVRNPCRWIGQAYLIIEFGLFVGAVTPF